MSKTQQGFSTRELKKIFSIVFAAYMVLAVAFYFLAGEQLRYRDSRGNIEMPVANAATVELTAGSVVEQQFTPKIQIFEHLSVQWGVFNRVNHGTVNVQLVNLATQEVLLDQNLQADQITEGQVTTFDFPTLETVCNAPLALRITSPDAMAGDALTPVMKTDATLENGQLHINGQAVAGELAFSATGRDYIWTGLHYWQFAAAGAVILAAPLLLLLHKHKTGKKSFILNAMIALRRYHFLIKQLVDRDFKAKYKRSILGVFWSFLNPLLNMIVQYVVFSNIFKFDIPYFPVYLLCGNVVFNYFSEACGMALTSIVGNADLIKKVYVPKYIYPLSSVLYNYVIFLISLIVLAIVAVVQGIQPTIYMLQIPIALILVLLLSYGCGMILATIGVFFRDMEYLWSVALMIIMYTCAIFYYPSRLLKSGFAWILKFNPLYCIISIFRSAMFGEMMNMHYFAYALIFSLVAIVVGMICFKKKQDDFILYI